MNGCKNTCRLLAVSPIGNGYRNGTKPRYANGQKKCQCCRVFMMWPDNNCPCCGHKLRTKRRCSSKFKTVFRH